MNRYYLQAPNGECLYSVVLPGYGLTFVGEIGTAKHLNGDKYAHTVATPGPVDAVHYEVRRTEWTDTATLFDPNMESKLLPLSIDRATYNQLDESLRDFYRFESVIHMEAVAVDVSRHIPLPAPSAELPVIPKNWQPSHWVHIYGPHASALVSGHLLGFRQHIKQLATSMGHDCYDHTSSTKLDFHVRSYWNPARHAKHKTYRGKYETRETWMTSRFTIDVVDAIGGATLKDALVNWEARTTEILDVLKSYATTRTCGHCDGRGFIPNAKE